MEDKADDILLSFNLSEEDLKSYKTIKEKFDAHFIQRRNIIFERACARCGQLHKRDKSSCPARDSICHKCHKKGHFKAVYADQKG